MGNKKSLMKSGSVNLTPNTFIGGVASVINTPALLAAKLQNYPSGTSFDEANIQNFTIVGDDIECYIGVDYQIKTIAFRNTQITASSPTYWQDYSLRCKFIDSSAFYGSRNTGLFYFPAVLTIGASQFYHENYGDADVADRIYYFPNCTNIGNPTVADTQMFGNTAITQKFYANTFLQTNNAGGVDATLTDGINNRGLIVVWILNQIAPNPITNLSIGNVYGTYIQLNFTAPTGSTNAIDFYEVYLNGKYYQNITASGGYIKGLTPNTVYNIEVKPVDIYYNKSTSNIVTQATSATLVYQDYLVSYYKMENNVLDSWGTNHGTPTAITYASGLVGQSGVFNGSSSHVRVADQNAFSFTDGTIDLPFSIIASLKFSVFNTSSQYYIASKRDNATTLQEWYLIIILGKIRILCFNETGAYIMAEVVFTPTINQDYLIIATYNGSKLDSGFEIYIENVKQAVTATTSGTYTGMVNTTSLVTIGKQYYGSAYFNGSINELSIVKSVVTQAEVDFIKSEYDAGRSII